MLIKPIQVSPWQANCYIVAADEDTTDCIIIDPGLTADAPVSAAVSELGLDPVALIATHGHVDHVGDAHLLTARWGVPLYLAAADQHLLTRPGDGLGPNGGAMMIRFTGSEEFPAVADVRDYGPSVDLAGLRITPFAAPGHTRGSTLLDVRGRSERVVFTGDVLFAGTIGRTDFQGGSMSEMRDTLARIVEQFPADVVLLPGHGQPTTLGDELAQNPYLRSSL